MIAIALLFFLVASACDIKTKEVPLFLTCGIILLRISYFIFIDHGGVGAYLLCGLFLFIFLMIFTICGGLGGADVLIGTSFGLYLGFAGIWAVLFGLVFALPYTIVMKATNTEHPYPFVPFLTAGFIVGIILLLMQGQPIVWFL